MALNGIDIASYQGALNQSNIAGNFSIMKATEGVSYVNPYCDIHYQQAKSIGRLRGVYHFADHGDVNAEANFFVDNISNYVGDAIIVLDWEGSFVSDVNWAKTWLDIVQSRTGVKPLIYMSEYVANHYDWSSVINADYGLWVAKYADYEIDNNYDMSGAGTSPNVNWGETGYVMWQWTSSGRLNGYAGNLDCDIFYGDENTWNAYARVPAKSPVVTEGEDAQTSAVPYSSKTIEDAKLIKGQRVVTTVGVNGIRTVVYKVTFTDGVESGRTVISDSITTLPIDEVISLGTQVVPDTDNSDPTNPSSPTGNNSAINTFIQFLLNIIKNLFKR